MIIICVYRTPQSDPTQFLFKLNGLLERVFHTYKSKTNVVIVGDFNINTLKKGNITNQLIDLSYSHNLKLHINEPTRKSSCIDHILSNIPDAVATVMPLHLSDHDTAQMLSIPFRHKVQIKQAAFYIYKRDFNLNNIQKFRECLQNVSWSETYAENDIDVAFSYFHELLCLFYNLCFPKIKVKVNTNQKKQNWISKGLKRSCQTKRSLRFQYYRNKNIGIKTKYMQYKKNTEMYLHIEKKRKY